MIFTVTLSFSPTSTVTVHYATADDSGGAHPATAGLDYTPTSGDLTFNAGEQVKTVAVDILADAVTPEFNETFLVNLSAPSGANIVDGQAVGTIMQSNPGGVLLISELRTSGPAGTTAPVSNKLTRGVVRTTLSVAGDDFVELYNNTDLPLTVAASDATAGYGIFKMGADCNATPVLVATIPNGTMIPARGHYLLVGSGYSLGTYATGDQTLTSDIEHDHNVAVFNTTSVNNLSSLTRLDAVGFGTNTGGVCDLLREGSNLAALSGSALEYSFQRDSCGKGGNNATFGPCPSIGLPVDTNNNLADFLFVDTTGANTAAGQRLGAPGPENLTSPIVRNNTVAASLVDPSAPQTSPPNRVRDLTPDPANNSTFGTLSLRRTFTNNTGAPITRLRFRVIDISAFPVSGGIADVRARTSGDVVVTVTGGGMITVRGTTLDQPPTEPLAGALNSSLTAGIINTGTPLAPGASVSVQFLLGVQQTGTFKFFVNIEALP